MFCQSVVAIILFSGELCWWEQPRKWDNHRPDPLIKRTGSVVGVELEMVVAVAEGTLGKLLHIMDNHLTEEHLQHRATV